MSETPLTDEPWDYFLHIPNDPRAVTVSRHTLRVILTVNGLAGFIDVAELLATELISNAVRHQKGPAALRVRWQDGVLQVGAWDADPEPPAPPGRFEALGGEAEEGRGLAIVQACSHVWAWQPMSRFGSRGKLVWCELNSAA